MVHLTEEEAAAREVIDFPLVGKLEKAHKRPIIGVFVFGENQGVITISHDCLKLWRIDETETGGVIFSERSEVTKWRCGVQSWDATEDGKCIVVVGLDSILYEIIMSADGPAVLAHDLGYMETWHIKVAKNRNCFMTTSYSGYISEIDLDGKFSRREPLNLIRQVSTLAYSNDNRLLAVGNNEGVVRTYEISTLKNLNTYEIHAMKIRAIVFLLDNDKFLTASDDKTLRLFSLVENKTVMTYCGCSSPILCISLEMTRYGGNLFATGSQKGEVLVWSVTEKAPLCNVGSYHDGAVWSVCFSPNGSHLTSVGEDGQMLCYAVPSLRLPVEDGLELHQKSFMDEQDLMESYHNGHGDITMSMEMDTSMEQE